jgi:hypothetical protein
LDLAAAAFELSVPLGLLITHHLDIVSTESNLLTRFVIENPVQLAAFGPAAWPALHIAGKSLYNTKSPDWLAVLETLGPAAVGGVAQGPLPDELCEQVLINSAMYPLQWVLLAETSRSRLNPEQPLLASTNTWFED